MSNVDFIVLAIKPCIKCGSLNRCKQGDCKDCQKVRSARRHAENRITLNKKSADWYAANIDTARLQHAEYRLTHAIQKRDATAAWRKANPEQVKIYSAAWRIKNKENIRIKNKGRNAANPTDARTRWLNRRAKKIEVGGKLSKGLVNKLCRLQKGRCACCGELLGISPHMDHIMPLALGGKNIDNNIQMLRAICNLQKGKKDPIDFMQSKGYLF